MELELSRSSFKIEGDYSNPERIKQLGWKFFHELKALAYEQYDESQDVGLLIHLEEGSLSGRLAVFTSTAAFYQEISKHSSFKEAIESLQKDGSKVSDRILSEGPLSKELESNSKVKKSAGVISEIKRTFDNVKYGKILKDEGITKVIDILEDYGTIPDKIRKSIENDFRAMKADGVQTEISDNDTEEIETKKRRRKSPDAQHIKRTIIEIVSSHRNEPPTLSETKK